MLKIYQSNQMQVLIKNACKIIQNNQKKNILERDIFVIENNRCKKWIEIEISKTLFINSNIKYITYQKYISNMLNEDIDAKKNFSSIFDIQLLQWDIMRYLEDIKSKKPNDFQKMNTSWKKFQFSKHISSILKKYILFRFKWIFNWENQKNNDFISSQEIWQKKLWNYISNNEIRDGNNITKLFLLLINKIKTKKPNRIFIFSLYHTNPFYNLILLVLQQNISVYWFQTSITLKKNQKDIFSILPFSKKNFLNKNNKLLNKNNVILEKKDLFLQKINKRLQCQKKKIIKKIVFFKKKNILNILKNDIILNNYKEKKKKKIKINDNSIIIYKCITIKQEVEKLLNMILSRLDNDKNLNPNEILITSYNIEPYLHYIKKIFPIAKIKYQLNILNPCINNIKNSIIHTIKNLLDIKKYKFNSNWILSILNCKLLRKKFNIKKKYIDIIKQWICNLQIKHGFNVISSKCKDKLNMEIYTWDYAIKRIISGCFFEEKIGIWKKILPYNVYSKKEEIVLGNFINFIYQLNCLKKKIKNKKKLKNWLLTIQNLIQEFFFIPEKYKFFFTMLEKKWANVVQNGIKKKYCKRISISILTTDFFQKNILYFDNIHFMSGYINIENIEKIRMIPFKMICVLGCNQSFLIEKNNKSLDLTIKFPCNEDKYFEKNNNDLFLEIIMSTQKYLYISYNIEEKNKRNTNENLYFIRRIKSYINNNFNLFSTSKTPYFTDISKNNFLKNFINTLNFQNLSNLDDNKKIYTLNKSIKNIIIPYQKKLYINDLIEFWKDPIKYFFVKTLNIRIYQKKYNIVSENEPFTLDLIDQNNIDIKLLNMLLKGTSTKNLFFSLKYQGLLPYGNIGNILWKNKEESLKILAKKIKKYKFLTKTKKIRLNIENFCLTGTLPKHNNLKLIDWTPNKINYKKKIQLWIQHLIYCSTENSRGSILLNIEKKAVQFPALKKKIAIQYLKRYIQGYFMGIRKPILILNAGILSIQELYKNKNISKKKYRDIEKKFLTMWHGNQFFQGEKKNYYIKNIITVMNDYYQKKIYKTCEYWWGPLFKNIK